MVSRLDITSHLSSVALLPTSAESAGLASARLSHLQEHNPLGQSVPMTSLAPSLPYCCSTSQLRLLYCYPLRTPQKCGLVWVGTAAGLWVWGSSFSTLEDQGTYKVCRRNKFALLMPEYLKPLSLIL